MTHAEKVNYMRIACNLAGIQFNNVNTDLLVSLYELVLEHKGELDMRTVITTVTDVEKRVELWESGKMLTEAIKDQEDGERSST